MSDETPDVHTLYPSNFRDVPATLRHLAKRIENGEFGEILCCTVGLLGDTLEVFGMGTEADPMTCGMVHQAAAHQFIYEIQVRGRR